MWGVITAISIYIFLAEIVNTVAERHVIPLGNAVFDYKNFKFANPFAQSPVSWTHTTPPI